MPLRGENSWFVASRSLRPSSPISISSTFVVRIVRVLRHNWMTILQAWSLSEQTRRDSAMARRRSDILEGSRQAIAKSLLNAGVVGVVIVVNVRGRFSDSADADSSSSCCFFCFLIGCSNADLVAVVPSSSPSWAMPGHTLQLQRCDTFCGGGGGGD